MTDDEENLLDQAFDDFYSDEYTEVNSIYFTTQQQVESYMDRGKFDA